MENPIFPNCSYFLAVGGTGVLNIQFEEAIALHGTRSFFCSDIPDLEKTSEIMQRIAGLFIFSDGLSADDLGAALKIAETKAIPTRIVSSLIEELSVSVAKVERLPVGSPFESLKLIVDGLVDEMIPLGLKDVVIHAVREIVPKFFPGLNEFLSVPPQVQDFDRQLNFSLALGDVVGYSAVLVNVDEIAELLPPARKSQALADLQEAINQCMGMIVQTLVSIGINGKLGLPTIFDTTRIPEIQTMIFFPSVRIEDSQKRFHLSLGFLDLNQAPLFDLSGVKPGEGSDDVEFL